MYQYVLIIIPWLIMVACAVWYSGYRDRRLMGRWLRGKDETSLQAVREWFKAFGFIAASIAAIFAFWQFDLADRRFRTDQRPWISSGPATAQDIEVGPNGLTWSISFSLKNSGLTPGLHVALGQEAILNGTPYSPDETRAKACSQAEQSMAAIAIFPRDDVPWGLGGGRITSETIDAFNKLHKNAPFTLGAFVVLCIAYRSPLDDKFHHTLYALNIETDGNVPITVDRSSPKKLTGRFRGLPFDRITTAD